MNAIQFFTAQLEAQERFRRTLKFFKEQFEVKDAESKRSDNHNQGNGQYNNGQWAGDVPEGN